MLLVFFSLVDVLPKPAAATTAIDLLAPGILALAVMSTAMVSLGIGTGFERQYGVLKRLGATPLGRPRWIAAKLTMVLAIEVGQVIILVPTALVLGWAPDGSYGLVIPAYLLGTAAFAGIGLLMAGTLRGTVTLAAANGLYIVLLLLGWHDHPALQPGRPARRGRGAPRRPPEPGHDRGVQLVGPRLRR